MNVQELIYRILNSGRSPTNALAAVAEPAPAPANALASAGGFGVSDPSSLPANLRGGAMPSSAPTDAVPQPSAAPAPQIAQSAPVAAGGPNMGIGNAIQNLFMPQRAARNQTVAWLQSQGMDEGTATLLSGNKTALQQFLLDRAQGAAPEYDFMNIDGTLVRTDKRSGQIQPLGQFGSQEEDLPASYQEYQLAKQDGFEGSYTDWKTMGVRDQNADFGRYQDVRKEIQQLPSYKNFAQAAPIYDTMVDALSRDTKAADLNLVYGLGKIFDPNSVVREGEMVLVKDTASLPDWLIGSIESVNGGARLQPATRQAILAEAQSRINAYRTMLDSDLTQYQEIASQFKMDPAFIIPPLPKLRELPNNPAARLPPPPSATAPTAPAQEQPPANPGGVIDWKDFIAPGRKR